VGEAAIGPRSSSLTMSINASGAAIAADNFKMLALYGRAHDGLGVQSNHLSCPSITAGRTCDGN
jgi:hypothetical protein